ncbi:hypothetical protein N781_03790 [Pontibacillus halophilus JSM 076056 = DSM 19796]|uniref:Uncharacterized protein n=1 Tax=Pontibacillus halophilus JSM 076056 = DSM 19796 TaxID=1385510 RepID=A0A0A5I768_9BACI|nr:hypothetical protein [Pontibacillus halophilus]KGX91682.1 hypothetical protein N781_03790 [Pontibacillus halophilus JSM 076056 = DSM 19796]
MKWVDRLDVFAFLLLIGGVWLHAEAYMTDFQLTFVAIPCLVYVMVVSDQLRKRQIRQKLSKRKST